MEAVKDVKETTIVELGALLDDGDGAVVTLVAGDTRLVAHRAVLAARSPVFMANTLEASSGHVVIPDVEGPVLRQLLAYLYTLQAPQLSGTTPQLLAVADKYGLLALKTHCEQQLVAQLAVENAAAAAVLAVRHSCSSLKEAAIAFIKMRTHQVMVTQGWADAMLEQTEDLIEVSRLLYDPPPETRVPAATGDMTAASASTSAAVSTSGSTSAAAAANDADLHQPHGRSPAAAVLPSPTPDEAAVSGLRVPAATGDITAASASTSAAASTSGSTSAAAADDADLHQPHGRTPAAAVLPSPTPDEAAVSGLRAPATRGDKTAASASTSAAASTSGSSPAADAATHQPHSRTPAAAAPPSPPPDEAAVSRLRSLSAKERNSRLRVAARQGEVGELRALLAAGADVAEGDMWQWTALHWAAREGHVQAARCLLEAGAQVGARSCWQVTPLHTAVWRGHAAVVRLLLASSADPNARDDQGRTPLHDAASCGRAEAVAALLEAGADRAARDQSGKTPLDYARQVNKGQLIEMLS